MKQKKLMAKILAWIGIPVAAVYIVSTALITRDVKQSVSQLAENELTAKSQSASYQIDKYFAKYINIAEHLKLDTTFQYFLQNTASQPDPKDVSGYRQVQDTVNNITHSDENIVDTWVADTATNHCVDILDGLSANFVIASRPWYRTLKASGKTVITDPYADVETKALTVSVITPYYKADGKTLVGVVGVDITLNSLYDTIKSYRLGESGFYILTSSNGQMVYFPNEALKNKSIAASGMSQNVIRGIQTKEAQFLSYTALGKTNYGCISTVGSTGWTVTTGLPSEEFFRSYQATFRSLIWTFGIALVIVAALIIVVSKSITKPLIRLKGTADSIAQGNLDVRVEVKSSDEVGQVAGAVSKTVGRLKQYIAYIDEVSSVLDRVAGGDLTFELHCDYSGEFAKVRDSLENIKATLLDTVSNINRSAEQVAGGSKQVADASQALAQGAAEQASSLEELSASVAEISRDVDRNAENAASANSLAESAAAEFRRGDELMRQMMDAMSEISASSGSIGKIIKAIQDIAFQTNILALNAAVEAARAGEAGKGFSVVAEEVRSLAGKSSQAAKDTSNLVQQEIQSVQNGSKIADETSQTFGKILASSNQSAELVKQIAQACGKQSEAVRQVTEGLNRVSAVVQNNSATSEESAASSEELSGQAQSLKEMIRHFKTE